MLTDPRGPSFSPGTPILNRTSFPDWKPPLPCRIPTLTWALSSHMRAPSYLGSPSDLGAPCSDPSFPPPHSGPLILTQHPQFLTQDPCSYPGLALTSLYPQNTTLDLLDRGLQVHVVVDACSSRR